MRVYITGSAGVGKTTYADELQGNLSIPLYHTDDLYDSKKNLMFSLDRIKKKIPLESDWIIEGSYYMPEYVRNADVVVYLKSNLWVSMWRIFKRWFKDKELRKRFGLLSTLRLMLSTITGRFDAENVSLDTDKCGHYTEKDRYNLCRYNAKKFLVEEIS